jgi:hypothetical protein
MEISFIVLTDGRSQTNAPLFYLWTAAIILTDVIVRKWPVLVWQCGG